MKLYGVENCFCKMVMSTTRQRAMSRQGVWILFCILITSITGMTHLICFETTRYVSFWGWSWQLFVQNSNIFHETTSNISSGGMGSILYVETTRGKGIILNFKNFNYKQDMFDLFETMSDVSFLGWSCMVLKIVSAKWWCLQRDNELCLLRGYGYYFVF